MPRLPVDGKKVVEYRISLSGKERELLQDISTSYRIQSIGPTAIQILHILEDPKRVVQIAYGFATVVEMLGIETGLPTVADIPEVLDWFATRDLTGTPTSESGNPSLWDFLRDFWTGSGDFEGAWPGGY